jgi:hypothetical protein
MGKLLSTMFAAGTTALRRRLGTVATLYGANALFALAYMAIAAYALSSIYGGRPLFERGVHGDDQALAAALREGHGLGAVIWAGVVLALIYFLVSELLTGGLLERLRDPDDLAPAEARRRFGAGAAAHFGRFVRAWLWSWLAWIPALVVLAVGAMLGSRGLIDAVAAGPVFGKLWASLLPGLALVAIAAASGDYARVLLVHEPTLAPAKAFFRSVRLVLKHPTTLVHFVSYVAAWLLVSGIYVLITAGHPFAGAAGAWLLFLLRQVLVASRVALRVAAFAGQRAYVRGA